MTSTYTRFGTGMRIATWAALAAMLHLVAGDGIEAAVNHDYPGTSIRGRDSVVLVGAPGGVFVNTFNANLRLTRDELYIRSEGIPLDLTLNYDSYYNLEGGPFGYGWSFSYGMRVVPLSGGSVRLDWGDGRRDFFTWTGSAFAAANESVQATLVQPTPSVYKACTNQGICYLFANPVHGKLTEISDPAGKKVALAYDTVGNLTSVSDDHGHALLFQYDAASRVVAVVDSATIPSRVLHYGYDSAGDLVLAEDAVGGRTQYRYSCPHLLAQITDPLGTATKIRYSPSAQVSRVDNGIEQTDFSFSPTGKVTTVTERIDAATSRVTQYVYDAQDRLAREIDALGGVKSYTYDAAGNTASITSPAGRTSTFTYDSLGNRLTESNLLGETETFVYDPVWNKPVMHTDPMGHQTAFVYDATGRLTSTTDFVGGTMSWTRDANGRVTSETDRRGNTTSYTYDSLGDLVQITAPGASAGQSSKFEYDAVHRLTRMTTPVGSVWTFDYDAANRLTGVTDPLGGAYGFTFDAAHNVVGFTDPDGRPWTFSYDAIGRLTAASDPGTATTTYAYDDVSRLRFVTDPGSHTTSFAYDALDSLTSLTDALLQQATYVSDADGNPVSRTDSNGAVTNYGYNAASRLTSVDYPGLTDDVAFAYDPDGKLTRATNAVADLWVSYDTVDRLTGVTDAVSGRALSYAYDADGNRNWLVDAEGGLTTFTSDPGGRLTSIVDPSGRSTTIGRDAAGRPAILLQPNGVVTGYTYDAANRLVGIDARRSDMSSVFNASYGYDRTGNRTASNEDGVSVAYTYDAAVRLASATYSDGRSIIYGYDACGNRASVTDSVAGTTTYSYDAAERLLSSTGADNATYTHDANGNRTSRTDGSGVASYTYGPENRLEQIDLSGSLYVKYSYDPLGRRIGKTGPGLGTVQWLRDRVEGRNVVAEYDASGTRTARYVSAGKEDLYLTYDGPAGPLFLQPDLLGTIRRGTDSAGATQASFEYLPFGEPLSSTGSAGDRAFTGADAGDMSGFVHLRTREYDAATARFLQRDRLYGSLVDPPNFNPYLYTGDSPQTFVDPTGEGWFAILIVIAVVVIVVKVVSSGVKYVRAQKKAAKAAKAKEKMLKKIAENDDGADRAQREYDENLNGALNDVVEAAAEMPGTSMTGPPSVPTNKPEGIAWIVEQFIDWLLSRDGAPGDEKVSEYISPHSNLDRPDDRIAGRVTYGHQGANSRDGVEASVRYGEGGQESRTCGATYGDFMAPGDGSVFGVAVDPADRTLFLAGEGSSHGVDLFHATREGIVIASGPIPYLGGGHAISVAGHELYVTQPESPMGSSTLLLEKATMAPIAQWVFSGPGNPNPLESISMASDLEVMEGERGPGGGQLALVSSADQPFIWQVELMMDQPAGTSSTWKVVSALPNPTGLPTTAMGLHPEGLFTTFGGTSYLHDPQTLQIVDSCPAAGGVAAYGGDSDRTDGSAWSADPGGRILANGGGPGGVALGDADLDGTADGCDNCPGLWNSDQADSDLDGWGDPCDCGPLDSAVHPGAQEVCDNLLDDDCDGLTDGESPLCAPVGEVPGLLLQREEPQFTWSAVAGATGYDLVRGRLSNLKEAGGIVGLGQVSCLDIASWDTQTEIDPETPDSGQGFFYLVRLHHPQGSYGESTHGSARVADEGDCPLFP